MVKSIRYYNHSPVFYILNVRQLQDVMNQIRLGQTEYYTFMFLSYGDMDAFHLPRIFSNIIKINCTVQISYTKSLEILYIFFQLGTTSNLRYIHLTQMHDKKAYYFSFMNICIRPQKNLKQN